MKEIIRVIKKLFGIYERGCEYWFIQMISKFL